MHTQHNDLTVKYRDNDFIIVLIVLITKSSAAAYTVITTQTCHYRPLKLTLFPMPSLIKNFPPCPPQSGPEQITEQYGNCEMKINRVASSAYFRQLP